MPSGRGRLPSRRGAELGKRERRKRRMDDADEDDLNSLDEPPEATKKRRRAGAAHALLGIKTHTSHMKGMRAPYREGAASAPQKLPVAGFIWDLMQVEILMLHAKCCSRSCTCVGPFEPQSPFSILPLIWAGITITSPSSCLAGTFQILIHVPALADMSTYLKCVELSQLLYGLVREERRLRGWL